MVSCLEKLFCRRDLLGQEYNQRLEKFLLLVLLHFFEGQDLKSYSVFFYLSIVGPT